FKALDGSGNVVDKQFIDILPADDKYRLDVENSVSGKVEFSGETVFENSSWIVEDFRVYSQEIEKDSGLASYIWKNSSFAGLLGYRIWGYDSSGNVNGTVTGSLTVNELPDFRNIATFNFTSGGAERQADFIRNGTVTLRANITDVNQNLKQVNLTVRNASGENVLVNGSMKKIRDVTIAGEPGGVYSYNYTLDGSSEIGTWNFTVWAKDSDAVQKSPTNTFDVYVPAKLELLDFMVGKNYINESGTVNVSVRLKCSSSNPDAEC
ncbi:MAG: hypothetical protein ABEJ72_05705, partial [Candidatus Aenigmatarchaeota archaeon]